jgi:hypothetical protein
MPNDKFQASQVQTLIRELELQSHKAKSFGPRNIQQKLCKNASMQFGHLKQKSEKILISSIFLDFGK